MVNLPKTKLVILAIIAVILAIAGYFYYSQKPVIEPRPTVNLPIETEKKSLADDSEYIQKRVDGFMAGNADIARDYAQDIILHEIAVDEGDISICSRIKTVEMKNHCYKFLNLK